MISGKEQKGPQMRLYEITVHDESKSKIFFLIMAELPTGHEGHVPPLILLATLTQI